LLKEIKQPFFEKYHRYPTEEDAQAIYADFEELLFKSIDHKEYTELTPHTREVIAFIKNDLKMYLTTTSGYPEVAAEKALTQFSLLFKVDAKSAGGKRIKMILNNMHQLGLSLEDSHRTLFITDAERDIASVRAVTEPHLMPWIVAIADYSTHVEIMSTEHANSISAGDFADKRQKAHEKLNSAHIVISHMGELPLAIIAVQRAIQNGCRPATTQSLKLCYPEDEMQEDYRPAVKLR
jgi:phosphoglycolate phosphatase-like HAD superfamily hydrolase